jgi:hypothetical protein
MKQVFVEPDVGRHQLFPPGRWTLAAVASNFITGCH